MTYITTEVAGWALLILSQVYLLKYRLLHQRSDEISAYITLAMATMIAVGRFVAPLIT